MSINHDYSSFFYFNPLPTWVYDIKTFQVYNVNKATIDIYQYSKEELLSLTIKNVHLYQDIDKWVNLHADLESLEENIHFGIFTHQKKNGELIQMDINGHKVDFQGEKCMMAVCRDITKERAIEIALQKSTKKLEDYKFALDQSAIVAITDEKGVISFVNDNFCKISQYSKEELIGNTHKIINSKLHSKDFFVDLWKTISSGNVWRGEIKNIAKDGSYYWVDTTIVPFLDDENRPFQYLAIRFDITAGKFANEEIQQTNERFEMATLASNDAIWDWNMVNNTIYRSNGIKKFFGKDTMKTISEKDFWQEKFHIEDHDQIKISINNAIKDSLCNRWEMEYRISNKQEKTIYVVDKGVILRDKSGRAIRMVGAMTDISDQKNFEQQLLKLNESLKQHAHALELTNEQLEQFAFIASHDLQEPLRMIYSFMDQLKRKYQDQLDDKALQYIHFATDGAKRMKQIILDLLEYSRAGKLSESIEDIDMNLVLVDYQVLRRKIISEKSVTLNINKLPIVQSYKAPLIQVLHCLLDNAINYSNENQAPVIEILAEELGDIWQISVQDNGIGIDSSFFEKIFVIFQRLHNKEQYAGTGIGLSIAKKQVESWGGKIWLESIIGEGSTFYFTIPKTKIK